LQYLVKKGAFIVKEILFNMLMFDYCFKPILQQRGDMWKMVKRILYGSRLYVNYGKKKPWGIDNDRSFGQKKMGKIKLQN
jgi:hypothetical protein